MSEVSARLVKLSLSIASKRHFKGDSLEYYASYTYIVSMKMVKNDCTFPKLCRASIEIF